MNSTTEEIKKYLCGDFKNCSHYHCFNILGVFKGRLEVYEFMKKSRGITKNLRKRINKEISKIKVVLS